jgi:hypothetical protein
LAGARTNGRKIKTKIACHAMLYFVNKRSNKCVPNSCFFTYIKRCGAIDDGCYL